MNGKFNLFIRVFICVLAYFYSVNVYASKTLYFYNATQPIKYYSTPNSACSALAAVSNVIHVKSEDFRGVIYCYKKDMSVPPSFPNGMNYGTVNSAVVPDNVYPVDAPAPTPIPIQCSYPLVRDPATNTCITDCQTQKGKIFYSSSQDGGAICADKCRAVPVKVVNQHNGACTGGSCVAVGGYWVGEYRYDGAKCTGVEYSTVPGETALDPDKEISDAFKPKMDAYKCAQKGMGSGTVNGQTICTGTSNENKVSTQTGSETTKTNPDGTSEKTEQKQTVTDEGGKVTTLTESKTTKYDKDGNPIGGTASSVASESKDKPSYCKENPSADQCKNDKLNFNCETFKCDGDLISCAQLRIQNEESCKEKKMISDVTSSEDHKLGIEILSGRGDKGIKDSLGVTGDANTIDLSDAIKTNGFLTCGTLADKTFNVYGKSIQIPFSKMNYWLELMGKIGVLFTLVVAARIIVGGKR